MSHMAKEIQVMIKMGQSYSQPYFNCGLWDASLKSEPLRLIIICVTMSRHEFDSENVPDLTKDVYMQDIHCVGSLCKLYFRELPNPLLTYQLYDKFAVSLLFFHGLVC